MRRWSRRSRELGEHAAASAPRSTSSRSTGTRTTWSTPSPTRVSIVDEVDSPGVAVIADTFHMSIEEGDIGAAIRAAGDRIRHVQLGDSNRLEPGAGHYDWPATLAALERSATTAGWPWSAALSGPVGDVLPRVAKLLSS